MNILGEQYCITSLSRETATFFKFLKTFAPLLVSQVGPLAQPAILSLSGVPTLHPQKSPWPAKEGCFESMKTVEHLHVKPGPQPHRGQWQSPTAHHPPSCTVLSTQQCPAPAEQKPCHQGLSYDPYHMMPALHNFRRFLSDYWTRLRLVYSCLLHSYCQQLKRTKCAPGVPLPSWFHLGCF